MIIEDLISLTTSVRKLTFGSMKITVKFKLKH